MSELRFYDLVKELDELVAAAPNKERIARFVELTKNTTLHQYAFQHLNDPTWIKPLHAKGFFSAPREPIRDEVKGAISFPVWPESRYLARMAARDPERVRDIVLDIPDTENIRVHEDFADAALAMPPKMVAEWARKEMRWVERQERLYFLLPERLGAVLAYLARGGEVRTALAFARTLLAVLPGPRLIERPHQQMSYNLPTEPQARFDIWDYEEILKNHMPDLVNAAGARALTLLCDLLDDAVRLSRRPRQRKGPEDYSYIWRRAIEEHEHNHPHGLRGSLVSAVRDAAEHIARADPRQVPALVRELEGRRPPWHVFQRLALHLLRMFPDSAGTLVAKRLVSRRRFDEAGLWHEYALLARDRFGNLSKPEQAKILSWIDEGPAPEKFEARGEEHIAGKPPTQQDSERYANAWRLRHLALLREALPPGWRRRYKRLVTELGEPEHPEFVSYTRSWVGPTSPRGAKELGSMRVEEILSFLRSWQPSGEQMSPSREGLGRQLAAVVASDPERFVAQASQFQGLDPTYVRALFSGLRDAAKEKRAFPWPPVLELCLWVVQQPREIPGSRSQYRDLDPGWVWTRKTIADLLTAGFEKGAAEIPFDLRTSAWAVLRPVTDDPDPTPKDEARLGGSNMDPATLSINTTRGEAMHAVVRYALWVRRHIENRPEGKIRVARGFSEMSEVREVLDAHLEPARDSSLAIRAVYGQWFPWLVMLDANWAGSSVPRIFPVDESLRDLYDAAWETYITFCDPYDTVFEVLQQEYGRALGRIGAPRRERQRLSDPEQRLGEHFMSFYWRGKLDLDDPGGLLARFYANAPDALRAHALKFAGRSLHGTKDQVASEILDRLQMLWDRRLSAARTAASPLSHVGELAAFGWWFASAKFDDTWATTQLAEVLKLAGKVEPDHLVVERLAAIAAEMPRQAVECLGLMIEGDTEARAIYAGREHARTILATAIQGTDSEAQRAAVDLVHRMGARGHLEFRDVLPGRSPTLEDPSSRQK